MRTICDVLLLLCTLALAATTTPCDRSLLISSININSLPGGTYSCPLDSQYFRLKSDWNPYYSIRCDPSGWMGLRHGAKTKFGDSHGQRIELTPVKLAEADSPLEIFCVKYCATNATGVNIKEEFIENESMRRKVLTKRASCDDKSSILYLDDKPVDGSVALCNGYEGWVSIRSFTPLANVFIPLKFECRKAPPQCTYENVPGIYYDDASKKLYCPNGNNTLMAIEFASKPYQSLTCRSNLLKKDWIEKFWSSENFRTKQLENTHFENWVADASSKLSATCFEYCVSKGVGLNVTRSGGTISVTCADPNGALNSLSEGRKKIWRNTAECSMDKGWPFYGPIYEYTRAPVSFECLKACTLHNGEGFNFDTQSRKLVCADNVSSITKIRVGSVQYDSLECNLEYGWEYEEKTIADLLIPLEATCVKYCMSSGNTTISHVNGQLEASCSDPDFGILFNSKQYKNLYCDVIEGWIMTNWAGKNISIAQSSDTIDLSCVKYPPSCIISNVEGIHLDVDANKTQLSCDSDKVIRSNSKLYSNISCEIGSGWIGSEIKDNRISAEFIAEADVKLNLICEKICTTTGTGIKVDSQMNNTQYAVRVTCPDLSQLFYGETRIAGNTAECSLYDGWFGGSILTYDIAIPQQFECRSASTTTITPVRTETDLPPITSTPADGPLADAGAKISSEIIGFSLGGIFLLVIIAVVVFLMKSKKKRAENTRNETHTESDMNNDQKGSVDEYRPKNDE